jgi:hypothetical protein
VGFVEDQNVPEMVDILWSISGRHSGVRVEYAVFSQPGNENVCADSTAMRILAYSRGATHIFANRIVANAKNHWRLVYCGCSGFIVALSIYNECK